MPPGNISRSPRSGSTTWRRSPPSLTTPATTRTPASSAASPCRVSTAPAAAGCSTRTRTAPRPPSARCRGAGRCSTSTTCPAPTASTRATASWRRSTAGRCCREPWQRCSYWWGLSSSAGFKPGVRIKLAFWLDRPVLGAELERHLEGCPIDASTLRAVQPIYIARPILIGVPDPIEQRTGLEQDIHDAVPLPVLPAEKPRPMRHNAFQRRAALRLRLARRPWPNCGLRRCAAPWSGPASGGRHRCLIWAAARAVELDDALPREDIAAALIAAAQRAGLDDTRPTSPARSATASSSGSSARERGMTDRGFYQFEGEPETEPKPKDDSARGGAQTRHRLPAHGATGSSCTAPPTSRGTRSSPAQWIVRDWIPSGHITGLYGHGGGGKTTLADAAAAAPRQRPERALARDAGAQVADRSRCSAKTTTDEIERKIDAVRRCLRPPMGRLSALCLFEPVRRREPARASRDETGWRSRRTLCRSVRAGGGRAPRPARLRWHPRYLRRATSTTRSR